MKKKIQVFRTIAGKVGELEAKLVLEEKPIGSKNFSIIVMFDFLKGDGYEVLKEENFHGLENAGIHDGVIDGSNKKWELFFEGEF